MSKIKIATTDVFIDVDDYLINQWQLDAIKEWARKIVELQGTNVTRSGVLAELIVNKLDELPCVGKGCEK